MSGERWGHGAHAPPHYTALGDTNEPGTEKAVRGPNSQGIV